MWNLYRDICHNNTPNLKILRTYKYIILINCLRLSFSNSQTLPLTEWKHNNKKPRASIHVHVEDIENSIFLKASATIYSKSSFRRALQAQRSIFSSHPIRAHGHMDVSFVLDLNCSQLDTEFEYFPNEKLFSWHNI